VVGEYLLRKIASTRRDINLVAAKIENEGTDKPGRTVTTLDESSCATINRDGIRR
jgi:hypothetical protein